MKYLVFALMLAGCCPNPIKITAEQVPLNDTQCLKIVEIDGFFSEAHDKCDFKGYDLDLTKVAGMCTTQIGGEKATKALNKGIAEFDIRFDLNNRSEFCHKVITEFPDMFKRSK